MATHVALLRGINVGGRGLIAMADLRALFEALGFADVKTLLQSGNVVFRGGRKSSAALERLLEVESEKRLNLTIDYLVRTAAEWESVVAGNPFPVEAKRDPSHLLVLFMKEAPDAKSVDALRAAITGPEILRAEGKQVYVVYPAGIGTSKLTSNLIERKLACRGTGRNWNTVLKLAALAQES
jgi:uncharacterized protein (DUF1697 family)